MSKIRTIDPETSTPFADAAVAIHNLGGGDPDDWCHITNETADSQEAQRKQNADKCPGCSYVWPPEAIKYMEAKQILSPPYECYDCRQAKLGEIRDRVRRHRAIEDAQNEAEELQDKARRRGACVPA